jgi:hypothetical protein
MNISHLLTPTMNNNECKLQISPDLNPRFGVEHIEHGPSYGPSYGGRVDPGRRAEPRF